jgi:hypothetical protein
MHQPNIFLNSYLGYTMWDYESDAPLMWPEKQKYPTAAEVHKILERNPEAAAVRGKWGDLDFLRNVYDDVNPKAKDTQFADYHGHGWNFRAIYKRDREGNLLDAEGKIVSPDDAEKFRKAGSPEFVQPGEQKGKAVHMMDIHAEKGLQCATAISRRIATATGSFTAKWRMRSRSAARIATAPPMPSRPCSPPDLPRGRRHQPRASPQQRRPAPLRMDHRRAWRAGADPALDRRPQARMEGVARQGIDRSRQRAFQRQGGARQADVQIGAETGKFAWGRASRPTIARMAIRHGLLHLPPVVDHLMRRLSPADRGELED